MKESAVQMANVQMAKSHVSMRTRAAQQVSVTAGRLTSRARALPNLLIVGSQRCGTTTLYRTLTQHPAVTKAVLHKGVHYFDVDYDHGLSWYRAHFPLRATLAARQRRLGVPPVVLESSPYYMFHPLAPERIARDLPDARVIALVRDPVERAYSAHSHELARGFETEPFERALELEDERLAGEVEHMCADPRYVSHSHRHHSYRRRGHYAEQVERLSALFGQDRVLVVESESF